MRNTIILGSGRSGTSMVAGLLAGAGCYQGDDLYEPRPSNPKGFFESPVINGINEDLLARVLPGRPPLLGRWCRRDRPRRGQRWLARLPVDARVPCPPAIDRRIAAEVARAPFCFKDPRFSYTLPAWRPHLEGAAFVCVFRDPVVTARSIVTECRTMPYLRDLVMDERVALEVWTLMYRHVLERHRLRGDWLFLHYDQVLDGAGIDRLEAFTGAAVDRGFPDPALGRTPPGPPGPPDARAVYAALCAAAEHVP